MSVKEIANEICDLFVAASAFEQVEKYPEAIAAYDLATQLLAAFTAAVDLPLTEIREKFLPQDKNEQTSARSEVNDSQTWRQDPRDSVQAN